MVMVYGGERFQAETVDVSKSGMLAACPVVPPAIDKDSEVLFELIWSSEPEMNTFIKGTIVRVIRDSDYDNVLLGVEFSEALARNPVALREFLEEVLGIERGAVRVVKDSEGNKSLLFDFDPVHREGAERLRAIKSSLFTSVDDLEEADRLLEGFGTGEYLSMSEGTGPVPEEDAPTEETRAPLPPDPEKKPEKKPEKEEKKKKEKKKEKRTRTPIPGSIPTLLRSLLPSFGRSDRGANLIAAQQARASVANIDGIDVQLEIDGQRRAARAVRLYCAGLKCEIDGDLPDLYRSVTMRIPIPGQKKAEVVLKGDITRVRPDPNSDEKGIFEVRLSLRNETGMLNFYRELVEQLSIGEA